MDGRKKLSVKCGQRIKELREECRLTQYQFAEKIGVKKSVISKYERGESFPAPDRLAIIADYFDTSVDYLLRRTDVREYSRGDCTDLRTELMNRHFSAGGKQLAPLEKNEIADFAEFVANKNE